MPNIVFASSVTPDKAIVHDNETFRVQWRSFNAGSVDQEPFDDRLVVHEIPEGCPGSDDQDHPIVFDSQGDGEAEDYAEAGLRPGEEGRLMEPTVGPFPVGSYRLTVTLDTASSMTTSFNCIEIVAAI